MSETKRFDDFHKVDCNECARYWDSSCDGANTERPCNSYLATRSVVLPKQIKDLQDSVKRLRIAVLLVAIFSVLNAITQLMG